MQQQLEAQLLLLLDFFFYDLPPGPAFLKLAHVINLQKVGSPFYLAFLTFYFENTSTQMLVYAVLYGCYGLIWLCKHLTLPD
jgi:hypothetical protein